MIKGKQSWTVSNIQKMYQEKKVLSFDHPIQRKSDMWSIKQKSLLIHSILANFPIPSIYILREDSELLDEKGKAIFNFSVLDGKQRLTNVLSFLGGEFSLTDDIPDITIEDEVYSIEGKYFVDLDEPVQFELMRFKFDIFTFEDCSNENIEDIFFRLNNSTPLTKSQVAKAKAGTEIAIILNELLNSKFFADSCNFSTAQRKTSDDQRCLLQSMMLLDSNYIPNFKLADFSEKTIMEYAESIKGNFSDKQENILKSAIQFLSDAFPSLNKQLRKISIPMIIYLADYCLDRDIKPMLFRQWFEYFVEEDTLFGEYKKFCSSGSTKLEKINGRLAIMAKSLALYNEIDIPDELVDKVKELEHLESDTQENQILETEDSEDEKDTKLEIESVEKIEEQVQEELKEDELSEHLGLREAEQNLNVEAHFVEQEEALNNEMDLS